MSQLIEGNSLDVLKEFPDNYFSSCITDPPYELGFMGKKWDQSGIAYSQELWSEVLRVLKPGAYLLSFGGTRTYHRMACAIEDSGFEIRDCIDWIYGSGFPKSLDISKALDKMAGAERKVVGKKVSPYTPTGRNESADYGKFNQPTDEDGYLQYDITAPATPAAKRWAGYGTALKPAHEPIVLARKPLEEKTIAANVLRWGTGGINVDGCRVPCESWGSRPAIKIGYTGGAFGQCQWEPIPGKINSDKGLGRFPANLILSYPEDVYTLKDNIMPSQLHELVEWLYENTE